MESLAIVDKGKWLQLIYKGQQILQHEVTSIYCSKKSWLQKFTTLNVVQLTYQYLETKKCFMYVCARLKKAGKWSEVLAQQPITVPNEQTSFLPVLKQRHEFQEIKQNRASFVWMKKSKDLLGWEESNRIINTLDSPKYCRLVKIPSHIGWSTVQ